MEKRYSRSKAKLIANFDDEKMDALIGVCHPEEGLICIVDGVGRFSATQVIDPVVYKELEVRILPKASELPPDERLLREIDIFIGQDDQKSKLTQELKHAGNVHKGDRGAVVLEKLSKEFNVKFTNSAVPERHFVYNNFYFYAQRPEGDDVCRYLLEIMETSRYIDRPCCRKRYGIRAIARLYECYVDEREQVKDYLGEYLRHIDLEDLVAEAKHKYPLVKGQESEVSMYLEDILVDKYGLEHKRYVKGSKLVPIAG